MHLTDCPMSSGTRITKSIRDKTLIKYKEGISSSLEVTQTQNQYPNSETDYLSAMLELLNAKSRLDKVLGNTTNNEDEQQPMAPFDRRIALGFLWTGAASTQQ